MSKDSELWTNLLTTGTTGGARAMSDIEEKLMQDFIMYLSLMSFKLLILSRPDGKELGDALLVEWRKRVIDAHATSLAQIKEAKNSTLGMVFGALIDEEGHNKKFMEAFDSIVARIESIIDFKTEDLRDRKDDTERL